MDFSKYMAVIGEKPLDNLPADGGLAAIFRTFACVGDSLSSGEMEIVDEDGKKHYYDLYEYSWGQFMARTLGSKAYNFSRGGMTAHEYNKKWAAENGCWDNEKAAQAYIFALGVNDISCTISGQISFGDINDVKPDWTENADTFCGHYAAILQRYKAISPDAKFFLMTIPCEEGTSPERFLLNERHREFLYALADMFDNTYVMDFRRFAPVYDGRFRKNFMLNGHLNPAGYLLTSKMVTAYIDYIIRNNPSDFFETAMMNSGHKNHII